MRWMAILAAILVVPVFMMAEEKDKKKDDKAPSYTKDIKPILEKNCAGCHMGAKAKGGFDVSSVESMLKGAKKTKKVIESGKAADSQFCKVLEAGGKPAMPPKKAKSKPTADEIALIKKWVDAGAKDDTN